MVLEQEHVGQPGTPDVSSVSGWYAGTLESCAPGFGDRAMRN